MQISLSLYSLIMSKPNKLVVIWCLVYWPVGVTVKHLPDPEGWRIVSWRLGFNLLSPLAWLCIILLAIQGSHMEAFGAGYQQLLKKDEEWSFWRYFKVL